MHHLCVAAARSDSVTERDPIRDDFTTPACGDMTPRMRAFWVALSGGKVRCGPLTCPNDVGKRRQTAVWRAFNFVLPEAQVSTSFRPASAEPSASVLHCLVHAHRLTGLARTVGAAHVAAVNSRVSTRSWEKGRCQSAARIELQRRGTGYAQLSRLVGTSIRS